MILVVPVPLMRVKTSGFVLSAASIVAKVTRDRMITKLGKKFNGYFWHKNFGYGTKQHLKAIKDLGITRHHRKKFLFKK